MPPWVQSLDQCVLPTAAPPLDLLLVLDSLQDIVVDLIVHECGQAVFLGEPFDRSVMVFPEASDQVVRHSCVQDHSAAIGHHVDIVGVHCDWEVSRRPSAARDDELEGPTARDDKTEAAARDDGRDFGPGPEEK